MVRLCFVHLRGKWHHDSHQYSLSNKSQNLYTWHTNIEGEKCQGILTLDEELYQFIITKNRISLLLWDIGLYPVNQILNKH